MTGLQETNSAVQEPSASPADYPRRVSRRHRKEVRMLTLEGNQFEMSSEQVLYPLRGGTRARMGLFKK